MPENKSVSFQDAWIVTANSDLNEGRGRQIVKAIFDNEEDALVEVQRWGVMGVGTGEIHRFLPDLVLGRFDKSGQALDYFATERVWGYRKNWLNKWDYGWIDLRDAPTNDPEYVEFLRLRDKFNVPA